MGKKEFIEGINQLNRQMKAKQDLEKEVVSDEDAAKAIIIVKNMKINEIGDAFLFAAALNTLNTWVKQSKENKKSVGYFFKGTTEALCRHLMEHEDPDVQLELQQDQGMPLLVAQIGDMQFSFHQVNTGENGAKFAASDLENPRLAWDGIRKQRCANSLFHFALENQYGRTNQMMDGSSFEEGLKEQMELYRSGAKTLPDLKHMVYGNKETEEEDRKKKSASQQTRMRDTVHTKNYPMRNKPTATLYEYDLKTFIEEFENRSVVGFIEKIFEEGFGYPMNSASVGDLKYALETVLTVLKQCETPEKVGIRLEYVREKDDEDFILMLTSVDENGKLYISATQLCGWNTMKLTENETIEYTDDWLEYSQESYHPSRKILAFKEYITKGLVDENRFSFDPCVYFYDAPCMDPEELEGREGNLLEKAPLFFAEEKQKLTDYLKKSVSGISANGRDSLQKLKTMFAGEVGSIENNRSYEQNYVLQTLSEIFVRGEKFLYLIDGRTKTGKSTVIRLALDYLQQNGKTVYTVKTREDLAQIPEGAALVYYDDVIPEDIDYEKTPHNVLSFDPFTKTTEEMEDISSLRTDAAEDGAKVYTTSFRTAVGFKDYGAGNNWLIRHFGLGLIQHQDWIENEYPIVIKDSPEEFSQDEETAHVIIPASVNFDEEQQAIDFDESCSKIDLYRQFAKGRCGVEMVIEDEALRNKILKELDVSRKRYQWLNRYTQGSGENNKELSDATEEVFQNSIVKNKYETRLKKYLGDSAWKKLSGESQNWLLSAALAYNDMKSYDPLLDFSGVALQVCKALETELVERLCVGYVDWLKKTYGDAIMEHLPEALKDDYNGNIKIADPHRVTIGSIPHVMGMDGRGNIENQEEFDTFMKFAKEELLADPENAEKAVVEMVRIMDYVRRNYRNKAAHKDAIDMLTARDCLEYCIFSGRKLGVLLDLWKE